MVSPRTPLFCSVELAARIERAAAALIAGGAAAAWRRDPSCNVLIAPIAGGIAAWAGVGSPFDKVAGLGFAGTPPAAELDRVEAELAARGAPVQVELASLAEAGIAELLAARGHRLTGFENVLGLALAGAALRPDAAGHDVRESGPEELGSWVATMVEGFASPDSQGVASHESFPSDVVALAMLDLSAAGGFSRYVARRGGVVAGAGGLHVAGTVAQLSGAATLPEHRRRGVQTALLAKRLADAARAGCEIAVITTQPGSRSQQNAQRQGFDLLYTRAIMVRA